MIGFHYKNEAAFSKAVVQTMRKYGWFVQRIETGALGRGVPDIYAIDRKGTPCWIELKRIHREVWSEVTVPWRPGQQGWLREVTRRRQKAFTIACCDNLILVIKHNKIYPDNYVRRSDWVEYTFLRDVFAE